MITVGGFNSAIDRQIELRDELVAGAVQRAAEARSRPGGKGLHVAQMAVELGQPACLVGLTDGAHDDLFAGHLRARGVAWHGVKTSAGLRQCLALREPDGRITEILEPGVEPDVDVRRSLLRSVRQQLADATVLVLSGSLPPGFAEDTYGQLVRDGATSGVPCLVDASGAALQAAIRARPWLVAPNADEASAFLGQPVREVAGAIACVRALHGRGVRRPVVTLGARGAVGADDAAIWHVWSDAADVRNAVGSGDCFLAGLAVGAARGEPMLDSLRRAVAAGVANAVGEETGFALAREVASWLRHVHVERVGEMPGGPMQADGTNA